MLRTSFVMTGLPGIPLDCFAIYACAQVKVDQERMPSWSPLKKHADEVGKRLLIE